MFLLPPYRSLGNMSSPAWVSTQNSGPKRSVYRVPMEATNSVPGEEGVIFITAVGARNGDVWKVFEFAEFVLVIGVISLRGEVSRSELRKSVSVFISVIGVEALSIEAAGTSTSLADSSGLTFPSMWVLGKSTPYYLVKPAAVFFPFPFFLVLVDLQ